MKNLRRRRPPVQQVGIDKRDFSLDKAIPRFAAAPETQGDRGDAIG
jgi:hypothetical protein